MLTEIISKDRIKITNADKSDLLTIAKKSYDTALPSDNESKLIPNFEDFITYENEIAIGLNMETINGRICNTVIEKGIDGLYFHSNKFRTRPSEGYERNNPEKFIQSIW